MRYALWLLCFICTGATVDEVAAADDFPNRAIQIIVPFPPGAIDLNVRQIAPDMERTLGRPVIVETRSGANGFVGTQAAAEAKPDGHTLLATTTSSIVLGPLISPNARFHVQKNFSPITGLYQSPWLLVVRKSLPAANLDQLISFGKANIGKLNYGSPGLGSAPHILGLTLSRLLNIDMTHVPYRGFAPMIQDLLGGSLDMAFISTGTVGPYVRSGEVIPIAVGEGVLQSDLGQVPDLTKAVPGFESVSTLVGLWAPAGTPKPIIGRLNAAAVASLNSSRMQAKIIEQGYRSMAASPEEFSAEVSRNVALSTKLIESAKAAGVKFD